MERATYTERTAFFILMFQRTALDRIGSKCLCSPTHCLRKDIDVTHAQQRRVKNNSVRSAPEVYMCGIETWFSGLCETTMLDGDAQPCPAQMQRFTSADRTPNVGKDLIGRTDSGFQAVLSRGNGAVSRFTGQSSESPRMRQGHVCQRK